MQQTDELQDSTVTGNTDTHQSDYNDQEPKPRRVLAPIALNEQGILRPVDSAEMHRVSNMMLSTGVVPKCFRTPEQVMLAMQMLRSLQVEASLGIRQVMVVNNALAIWGELPKAACQKHIEQFDEYPFTQDYVPISMANKNLHEPVFGVVTHIKRRDFDTVYESYFTEKQARTSGLWGKAGPWSAYPDRMLQMRSRSRGLKDAFPDILSGVAIAEYDYNILDGKGEPLYGDGDTAGQRLANKINALDGADSAA